MFVRELDTWPGLLKLRLCYGAVLVSSDGRETINSPTSGIGGDEEGGNEEHSGGEGRHEATEQEPPVPAPVALTSARTQDIAQMTIGYC